MSAKIIKGNFIQKESSKLSIREKIKKVKKFFPSRKRIPRYEEQYEQAVQKQLQNKQTSIPVDLFLNNLSGSITCPPDKQIEEARNILNPTQFAQFLEFYLKTKLPENFSMFYIPDPNK